MKEYEVVHKIFNNCANNYSRDIFIEEIEIPEGAFEEYLRGKHKDKDLTLERTDLENGSIHYTVIATEIKHDYTFTAF